MTGLQGKKILFGVTGGIAAFKAAGWVHALVKEEAGVTVVMTGAAARFVAPLTFSALSGNRVHVDMFADDPDQVMAHITLAREADLVLIAPATANTMAKLAHGLADNLLTTVVLAAAGKPVLICPAMNSAMYAHQATRDAARRLRELGYTLVEPDCGRLACGEEGPGRLPEWEVVREELLRLCSLNDLQGQHILITAGPTREPLDPARFLSNRSSGKMGFALARTARRRGAAVTLVAGPVVLEDPPGIDVIRVTTAAEMRAAVMEQRDRATVIVKAAAVADFRPARPSAGKMKKREGLGAIELVENADILAELGRNRKAGQVLVGFAAESDNLEEEGRRKLQAKNLDLVVVNDIGRPDAGFDVDTNQVILVDRTGSRPLPLLSKEETADRIWDHVGTMIPEM
ncbi:MAG: bifunctional phosphopantothenoylcysteine decarboxylase/phosphopantothenate--cysteine ligase CoaBC [Desulfobulbaceae bacterium]|jgi:phosphopantothenoylcysteine decarboxylase/phosphopantothenate--cysteine ligase|nr:bifunctional phosphopantothenoylcysteine decarboxylase/phosphopantothenate--cysteine ligase CoaBC [Desulfobulbaceae bacterium]